MRYYHFALLQHPYLCIIKRFTDGEKDEECKQLPLIHKSSQRRISKQKYLKMV